MDYDRKQYFQEHDDPTVSGFTVIDTDPDEGYRVAEQWQRTHGNQWVAYWVSEDKLSERVAEGQCEAIGEVTDEQFEKICQRVEEDAIPDKHYVLRREEAAAKASGD